MFARLVCMLLSHCLNVGSGVSMAVRCILSALAFLWRWDQLITQHKQTGGDKRVKRGRGVCGGGRQGSRSALPSHSTHHEVNGLTTPSATWDTGENSHPIWNVMQQFGMYGPWNVEEEVNEVVVESNVRRVVPVDMGGHPNDFFPTIFCYHVCLCTI